MEATGTRPVGGACPPAPPVPLLLPEGTGPPAAGHSRRQCPALRRHQPPHPAGPQDPAAPGDPLPRVLLQPHPHGVPPSRTRTVRHRPAGLPAEHLRPRRRPPLPPGTDRTVLPLSRRPASLAHLRLFLLRTAERPCRGAAPPARPPGSRRMEVRLCHTHRQSAENQLPRIPPATGRLPLRGRYLPKRTGRTDPPSAGSLVLRKEINYEQ